MSAAATAAGYLYASGRLRGRAARDQEQHPREPERPDRKPAARKEVRVAVMPAREEEPKMAQPRKAPKIEYRTRRRWSAE